MAKEFDICINDFGAAKLIAPDNVPYDINTGRDTISHDIDVVPDIISHDINVDPNVAHDISVGPRTISCNIGAVPNTISNDIMIAPRVVSLNISVAPNTMSYDICTLLKDPYDIYHGHMATETDIYVEPKIPFAMADLDDTYLVIDSTLLGTEAHKIIGDISNYIYLGDSIEESVERYEYFENGIYIGSDADALLIKVVYPEQSSLDLGIKASFIGRRPRLLRDMNDNGNAVLDDYGIMTLEELAYIDIDY